MVKEVKKTVQVKYVGTQNGTKLYANGDEIQKKKCVLKASSRDGATTLTLVSPEPLDGFNTKQIIDLAISTSQTALKDFDGYKDKDE